MVQAQEDVTTGLGEELRMIGMEGPGVRNELTLIPVPGGTLLTLVITYPSLELRDDLATDMVGGMEASYARLEEKVLAAA